MFRTSLVCAQNVLKNVVAKPGVVAPVTARYMSKKTETDEEKDARYEAFFNRSDLDGYDLRRGINEMFGEDMVPEPKILVACLKAIRKENDFAMAIRLLEAVKAKAGEHAGTIYPYIIQELRPTLTELGINTPEELGYDKPELALENVYEM